MKQGLIMGAAPAGRSLRVLVTSAMLFAALAVTGAGIAPSAASAALAAAMAVTTYRMRAARRRVTTTAA